MCIEKDSSVYSVSEVTSLLRLASNQSVYYARSVGKLPQGFKIGGRLHFPKYQIEAVIRGEDWKTAKPPLDAITPAQAEVAAEGSSSNPSTGAGSAALLNTFLDKLAEEFVKRLEKKLGRGER